SNSFMGDSTIFEDKLGNVGIGSDPPGSRLTVVGTIETTVGGLKFPDGSLQTTAAVTGLQSIAHDDTLNGDGTSGSPLKVAVPLKLTRAFHGNPILLVSNTHDFAAAFGIIANGGSSTATVGRAGVHRFAGA